ncbi:hypothetical protein M0804_013117 [Polistes exclamans]|nr:hypothetical protein M0804_013117 [Polistes exclamans]
MSQAVFKRRRITVGLTSAIVLALHPKQLQCCSCLARGHVEVACPAQTARPGVCFVCWKTRHIARDCQKQSKCPVCVETGRPYIRHRAESWLCPIVQPLRVKDSAFARTINRPGDNHGPSGVGPIITADRATDKTVRVVSALGVKRSTSCSTLTASVGSGTGVLEASLTTSGKTGERTSRET